LQELHGFGIFGRNSFRMRSLLFIGISLFFGYSYTQTTGTITDARDGKVYKTVVIGNQTWMAENLNVSTFRNGDPIPEAKSDEEWVKAGQEGKPVWCYYNNDNASGTKYGKWYNWYAVNDARGLAPKGWHVPSHIEWTTLTEYLGGKDIAGEKMKSSNGWFTSKFVNGNGNNTSGFSGLPGGFRTASGSFFNYDDFGYWWHSSQFDTYDAWFGLLSYLGAYIKLSKYSKVSGLSVRCIKD
jgi:uncharacterized protein (TIGR02145 family)